MSHNQAELDHYLSRFRRNLVGSRRYRRELVEEVNEHLNELADALGASTTDAIERFGDADLIAHQLNTVWWARQRRNLRRAAASFAVIAAAILASIDFAHNTATTETGAAVSASSGSQTEAVTLDPRSGTVLERGPTMPHESH